MTNIIQSIRDARELVAQTQRTHAKDWLDAHEFDFIWKSQDGELVLVTPAEHNAGVLLRPDEALTVEEHKELSKYVSRKTKEDARLKRMRRVEV